MWCREFFVVASFLAAGSYAYAPIQMVTGPANGIVVLPKGFLGNMRGMATPQKLSVGFPIASDFRSMTPYFTAKFDQTIRWDDMGLCLEAAGDKSGNEIRVNQCTGEQVQKWNWVPDDQGSNMIQLKNTNLCIDAGAREVGPNEVPIQLHDCAKGVTAWKFKELITVPADSADGSLSHETHHVLIALITLAGLGAASVSAWLWQLSKKKHQGSMLSSVDQEMVPAAMLVNAMQQPSRPIQTRAARTCESHMVTTDTYEPANIRNFSIIAHIDHGKSTLADRLLESTRSVTERKMKAQVLDNMDLERERGITIKLQAARMDYVAKDGQKYVLNLIDTPGHVDFSYEVSRSLQACEGALLVVDASQGVEAQTIANVFLALDSNLEIIPVLNKIDLPSADVDACAEDVEGAVGIDCTGAIPASAKSGLGISEILEAIVQRVPPPLATVNEPLRALIFDSYYDTYRGVVVFIRVVDGELRKGDKVHFSASGKNYECLEVGVLTADGQQQTDVLRSGEVGYMQGGIKAVDHARVGDTISIAGSSAEALPGYQEPVPRVYSGLFPVEGPKYQQLRDALEKLKLNDAALTFEAESSTAMGFGFRCGFLGRLHMEIVQERLEREYDCDLIITAPSVVYKVERTDGSVDFVDSPAKLVDQSKRESISEPYVLMDVLAPKDYSGALMELCQQKRGEYKELKYVTESRVSIKYEMPLAEVIADFFDEMKSRSAGYASMEYSIVGYRPNDLVRLDILIAEELAPALACIVHRSVSYSVGKAMTKKLKELIPRQMFKVSIQAAIGTNIVASSQISPMRKDVLAKCYGGDISRKKKLLQKQAKGKKRMKSIGRVNVPQEAFMAVLNLNDS